MNTQKKVKREAAEARQVKYDALSTEQKIALVQSRPGNSKRELARLNKELANA